MNLVPKRMQAGCMARAVTAVAGIALLGGCTVMPTPVTESDVQARVAADQAKMYEGQEKVEAPIGFDEAVARALKYNLDYRLKLMESALSAGMADVAQYDMLPGLLVSAGYNNRSNESGGTSVNIATGAVSLAPSTSQERRRALSSAEFSWNVLDFGVSYYRAHQQADQVMIAEERRRRVIQNILQDVRSAYWRAVGAQRLVREAEALNERVKAALQRSRDAETQGLLPPKEALTYQRLLLDAVSVLATRRQELEFSRIELAALMNMPPAAKFSLVEADEPPLPAAPDNITQLEDLALNKRPELHEEDYRVRISAAEARRQMLSFLPGISFNESFQHDSNRYLYNNQWAESGIKIGFNLFHLLALPAMEKTQEAQRKTDDTRRLAISMAVLTQVRVAVERYRMALQDLEVARDSSLVDQRLAGYARAALNTRTDSELELIRAETRALNSEYQCYAAYAAAQSAFGRVYNSLGLEVVPENIPDASLPALSQNIAQHIAAVEKDIFPKAMAAAPKLPPLRLSVIVEHEDTRAVHQDRIFAAIEKALVRNRIDVSPADTQGPQLTMRLELQPVREGVRRADWVLTITNSDDSKAGETRYTSMLSALPTTGSLSAFGEAAVVANLKTFSDWLQPKDKK